MLFVGLGGSGGKTLRVLKRDIKEWLNDHDYDGAFPSGWQFVHIDTPSAPDGMIKGGGSLDDTEYLGLIGAGVSYQAVASKIDGIPDITKELSGWRVNPTALGVPLTMGAGQFRAIGRAVAMCYSQPIKERLALAIARLNNPGSSAELGSVYAHVNGKPAGNQNAAPIAVIVSSLAGGTGAGLLVDVCDILRALEPTWGSESIALLYTPEVFLGLGQGAIGGVQPNSLAAISEVLNGYWWHGGDQASQVPKKSLAALRAAGIAKEIAQSGPFCPFLIGSTSAGGVQYQSDRQLFETVGAALVSWATDTKVQQNFVAYTIGNWEQSARFNQPTQDVLVNFGEPPTEPGYPAFSALGFSRVSLGTKYLKRYSSKRLAKDALLHLANAHLSSAEAQAIIQSRRIIDPEEIVNEIADRYVSWFLHSAQLDELGPERNQIQDRLMPRQWWVEFDSEVSRARTLSEQPGTHSSATWIQQIIPAIETATKSFDGKMREEIQKNVDVWLKTAPDEVLALTEDAISRFGLKVTAALLMKVAHLLGSPTEGVVAELLGDKEMNSYLRFANAQEWQAQLPLFLNPNDKSRLAADHPSIDEAIREAMKYSTCLTRALLCERTADLIADFVEGFVKPLSRSLADAAARLDNEIDTISDWPSWDKGLPPQDLTPPRSEWTLIDPEEFSDVFEKKLAESFAGVGSLQTVEHQRLARNEIVSGSFIRRLRETSPQAAEGMQEHLLLSQLQMWTADLRISGQPEPRREAIFQVNARPDDIDQRATIWLMQRGTPFELLLSSDLRSYTAQQQHLPTGATPGEYQQRQQKFIQQLRSAISSAEPLVGLDQNLLGTIHPSLTSGGQLKIKRDVSEIPLLAHPLENEVRTVLEQTCYEGVRAGQIDDVVVAATKLPYIDVISQLDMPVSPLVVKSLMDPISNAWTQAKTSGVARGGFWTNRRGRTLTEFVPVPQEHFHAMLRGWFTGKLLGLIRGDLGKRVEIVRDVNDASPRWVSFPDVTLTTPLEMRDQLPTILESLPLAYAAVGTVSSLDPLDAYCALRDLGRSASSDQGALLTYTSVNPVLKHWLATGEVPNADRLRGFSGPRGEISGATEAERREKVNRFLKDQYDSYERADVEYQREAMRDPSVLGKAPIWPSISEEIKRALEDIRTVIAVKPSTDDF